MNAASLAYLRWLQQRGLTYLQVTEKPSLSGFSKNDMQNKPEESFQKETISSNCSYRVQFIGDQDSMGDNSWEVINKMAKAMGLGETEYAFHTADQFLKSSNQAEIIVCFGRECLKSLLGHEDFKLDWCSRWHSGNNSVLATLDFQTFKKDRDLKRVVWNDLQQVIKRLK